MKEEATEISNLVRVMRHEVIQPLLRSHAEIAGSQARFDNWHRKTVGNLKANCTARWDYGSNLTVGLAQKLIQLQFEFRQKARQQGTYPLALECWYWNNQRKT